MKKKVALFVSAGITRINDDTTRPVEDWAEGMTDYVRVSEYVDIEFPDRAAEEYVGDQIKHLRQKQEIIRADAAEKMQGIEELIGQLEALEHLGD